MTSAVASPRSAILCKVALTVLAGFVDVGVGALLLAHWGLNAALAWAIVAATLSGLGYLVLHLCAQKSGRCAAADENDESDGLASRLDKLAEEIEARPADNPDPLLIRWFWNAAIGIGWAVFSAAVVLLSYPRTLITVAMFALLTSPSAWSVAGAVVVSIGIQFTIVGLLLEPRAKKQGLTL